MPTEEEPTAEPTRDRSAPQTEAAEAKPAAAPRPKQPAPAPDRTANTIGPEYYLG
jgi:hypothetical protein